MATIRGREVLKSVLIQVLSGHKDGLRIQEVYDAIDKLFNFPTDWYRQLPTTQGYKELEINGYSDWRAIDQELLVTLVKTEPQWQNEMRWARNDLRESGHLDGSAPRGIWRLTEKGELASTGNANEGLNEEERKFATKKVDASNQTTKATSSPVSLREGLVNKLLAIIASMPISDLELLVELSRVVRSRSLPEK